MITIAAQFKNIICAMDFIYIKAFVMWLFKLLAKINDNNYNNTMVHVKN